MSLNETMARRQLAEIKRCAKQMQAVEKGLRRYGTALNQSWSAPEIRYLSRVVEDLSGRSRKLTDRLNSLYRDMDEAIEDILAEEAAEEAAAATERAGS